MSAPATETRPVAEIVLSFNMTINNLLKMLESRSVSPIDLANLDRVRARIGLLRSTYGGQYLVCSAGPVLYACRDAILARTESFFLDKDIRAEHGSKVSKDDEFVFALIDSIKTMYKTAKQSEKDELYKKVTSMFTDYIGFCIKTGCDPMAPSSRP